MRGDLERREKELNALRLALNQDPTNIELADRYWAVIGFAQSGGAVRDAYGEAAVASSAGAAALARASRDLFRRTGEMPKAVHFNEKLIQALKHHLGTLTGQDHSNVEWVLQRLGVIP